MPFAAETWASAEDSNASSAMNDRESGSAMLVIRLSAKALLSITSMPSGRVTLSAFRPVNASASITLRSSGRVNPPLSAAAGSAIKTQADSRTRNIPFIRLCIHDPSEMHNSSITLPYRSTGVNMISESERMLTSQ